MEKVEKVEKVERVNRLEGWLESLGVAAQLPSGWTGTGKKLNHAYPETIVFLVDPAEFYDLVRLKLQRQDPAWTLLGINWQRGTKTENGKLGGE